MQIRLPLSVLLVASLVACSSSESAEKPAGGEGEAAAETALSWEERTDEQKGDYMKEVVKPEMAKLLKGFDAEEFGDVTCKTCHGKDPKAVHFEMPSKDLPILDPTDNFAKHREHHDDMVTFMQEQVTPKMAELLGKKPWSPDNPEGFGCFGCHVKGTWEEHVAQHEEHGHDEHHGEHHEGGGEGGEEPAAAEGEATE